MFDRFLKKSNPNTENTTNADQQKSSLDELSQSMQVIDKDKMKQIEGGLTSNTQFSDRFDWNSTPGGNVPS